MTTTGIDAFDKTVHVTNEWLHDLTAELNLNHSRQAYQALRATLHNLRDRLLPDEAVHLGAQLPMLIRGFYYEGWEPSRTPDKSIDKPAFLNNVHKAMAGAPEGERPEDIVRAVFKLLHHRISEGEIEQIKQALPSGLRELWPTTMA